MAKRKPPEPPPGAPACHATFADLMNLLLCFFVLLFSMSSVDAQKFELLAASFNQTYSIFEAGATATLFTLKKEGVSVKVSVTKYMEGVYLTKEGDTTWEGIVALQSSIKKGDVVSVE
ncbi:MAG: chemotaxis protein, partial [Lachnospiraceae bacterium]|nr:chemotaxis protein [Lachnospiraceae bacterium]